MLIDYHHGLGPNGAWGYVADGPPAPGDEIVITQSSGLPRGNSTRVRVKHVGKASPFTITATMLW
jgi:hypothetical protein